MPAGYRPERISRALRVRRAVAVPVYIVALAVTIAGGLLAKAAETIAGDS